MERHSLQKISIEVTEEYLKEKLYEIRGKRVLLDADFATLLGIFHKSS